MTGGPGGPADTADGSSRSLEVERKYDVDDATPLPDWSALPGIAAVGEPERRDLDARYLDTADRSLSQARVAVRRRSGGPDEGWHVKIAAPDGKHEWHWPLDAVDGSGADARTAFGDDELPTVPDAVIQALSQWAPPPFQPLARIRNTRTAYALRDADGGLVAEFVDDRVRALDSRTGAESAWREWELELGPTAPADPDARAALFAAADELVTSAGGRVAASASKLGKALGA